MTDLLSIDDTHAMEDVASPANGLPGDAGHADDRRTFRAATLDAAVEAARAELGPDVELIEAHRVRRGGLGGFFATDLGVEIIAAPSAATTPAASTPSQPASATDGDDFAAELERAAEVTPAPPAHDVAPATGIDRLIQHAESHDRIVAPEHSDLVRSMRDAPIGEDELVSAPTAVPTTEAAEPEQSTADWFAFPDDEVSALVADGLSDSTLEMAPVAEPFSHSTDQSTDHLNSDSNRDSNGDSNRDSNGASNGASNAMIDPDVEAANWLDQVMAKDATSLEIEDDFWADSAATNAAMAAAPIDIELSDDETTQIERPTVPSVAIEVSTDRDAESSLVPTGYDRVAGQLVESLWALGERNDRKLHGVSVTITLDDGATVSVAAEFTGDAR